jgi:hypothetical protein
MQGTSLFSRQNMQESLEKLIAHVRAEMLSKTIVLASSLNLSHPPQFSHSLFFEFDCSVRRLVFAAV